MGQSPRVAREKDPRACSSAFSKSPFPRGCGWVAPCLCGTTALPARLGAWIYLARYAGSIAVTAAVVVGTNPGVIRARAQVQSDAKRFDKLIVTLYTLLTLALPIFAGLDAVRFQWAPLPFAAVYFAGALFLLSMIPIGWTLAVHPYLETTVRIQSERGHVQSPPDPTASSDIPRMPESGRPHAAQRTARLCEYAQHTPYRLLPALW